MLSRKGRGAFDVKVLAGCPVLPTPLPPLPPGEKMLFSEALRVLFLEITAKLQDDAGGPVGAVPDKKLAVICVPARWEMLLK
jgi:hypothetical protein